MYLDCTYSFTHTEFATQNPHQANISGILLKFRMSENRISEIHKAKDPLYHGGPRVKKSTFFVVAGLTNLVWEKLEPLPRFSAVIGQKTDIWTKF